MINLDISQPVCEVKKIPMNPAILEIDCPEKAYALAEEVFQKEFEKAFEFLLSHVNTPENIKVILNKTKNCILAKAEEDGYSIKSWMSDGWVMYGVYKGKKCYENSDITIINHERGKSIELTSIGHQRVIININSKSDEGKANYRYKMNPIDGDEKYCFVEE